MKNILLTTAIVLLVIWGTGFFLLVAGTMIHILLVLSLVFFILRILLRNRYD